MIRFLLSTALTFLPSIAFSQTVFLDDATRIDPNGERSTIDVIIRDGAITSQAKRLKKPRDAEVIENGWLTSGLFAPMSTLGLTDIGSSGPGNDIASENSETNVSERAADSYNPRSPYIGNTVQRGVTHAVIAPRGGEGSIFAGTGAVISLTGGFDSVLIEDAFVMVELGETGTRRAGGSRAAALAQLGAAISDAKGFFRRYSQHSDGGDILSRQDAAAFVKAVNGDIPLMIRVSRAADISKLITLKNDNPALDIIIVGAEEAWELAESIAAADIRVILDPLSNLPSSFETAGARLDNASILQKAGVDYAIANLSSLGVANASILNQHAGNAVAQGLKWDDAFRAISSVPMDWFGIKDASLVAWDGDPLEVTSAPIAVSINGQALPMTSRTKALRDRYNPTKEDTRAHKYR